MSNRSGTTSPKQKSQKQKQSSKASYAQPQAQPKPKPSEAEQKALAAQDAARREARIQRQAEARAEAERKRRQANIRKYGIIGAVALVAVAVISWLVIRELNKPGQAVDVMSIRNHLTAATDPHVPYNSDPPTSGPHTNSVPAFIVYATPIPKEEQVHGLEDGGVVINYKPDLDAPTVEKLASIARVYQGTPGKQNVLMSPYPGLSNAIVLTTWGRIDRLDTLDEARIRNFIDAYVNIDHHEGSEGRRLP